MAIEPQHPHPSGEILPIGTRIEGHVIEQWLAAVPDGHVYRVTHLDTGVSALLHEYLPATWARRIVDKVSARPGRGHEYRGGLHRFLQRAHQLAEIPRPGLPTLLRVWTSHGTAYCLMPDVRGRLLLDVVNSQGGSLPASQVLPWVASCCEIAQWLHAQGKIHAAWDPSAIWVLEDERLLLPAPDAGGGALPASPWVALEQTVLAPSGCEPGPWTDVFGIAALAGFLLTGKGPRGAPGGLRTGNAVNLSASASPRAVQPEALPAALMTAIRVSLRPNPRERPQDIGQFRGLAGLTQLTAQLSPPPAALALPSVPTSPSAPPVPVAAQPALPAFSEDLLPPQPPDSRAFAATQPPLDSVPPELLPEDPPLAVTPPAQASPPQPGARRRVAEPVVKRKRTASERSTTVSSPGGAAPVAGPARSTAQVEPAVLIAPVFLPPALPVALPVGVPEGGPTCASANMAAPPAELPLVRLPEPSVTHRELAPLPEAQSVTAVPVPFAPVSPPAVRRAGSHNGFRKELALAVMGVLAFATVWLIVAPADPAESLARKSSSGTLAQQQADLERELRQSPPAAGPLAVPFAPTPALPSVARTTGPDAAAVTTAGVMAAMPDAAKATGPAPTPREATPKNGTTSPHLSACTQALLEESLGAAPRRKGVDCR